MSYIPPPAALPSGSKVWAYLRNSGGESQNKVRFNNETRSLRIAENMGLS